MFGTPLAESVDRKGEAMDPVAIEIVQYALAFVAACSLYLVLASPQPR